MNAHDPRPTVFVIVRDGWAETVRAPVVRNADDYRGAHRAPAHSSGIPVINLGAVVDRRGDYPGRRHHRRPKNTSDWPDGLVYLSGNARDGGAWRRVDGPYPDDPLDLAPPAPTVRSRPNPRPEE